MQKPETIAIIACLGLSLVVFVGSTGLGYAEYRPLRNFDIFAFVLSWAGLAFHMWRGRSSRSEP